MPQENISYDEVNLALFEMFPILKSRSLRDLVGYDFERELPSPYVVFGDIFRKYLLEYPSLTDEQLNGIAEFMERMANSPDDRVGDLLKIEILPPLLEKQTTINFYWPYLGLRTRHLLSQSYLAISPEIQMPR
jgi:hypothetical protein